MGLYGRDDSGDMAGYGRMQEAGADDILIVWTDRFIKDDDIEKEEQRLSEKTGRKVVIMDGKYQGITAVPPFRGRP